MRSYRPAVALETVGIMPETTLVRTLLIRASEWGARLFRNNVGMLEDRHGNKVRYGLCVGSSDVIGWLPVVVTPEMVGQTVAVFVAFETKMGVRRATDEQAKFLRAVAGAGGIAAVIRDESGLADAQAQFEKYTLAR